MFRLCLQPSSGKLLVQIRYKYFAKRMGSHKDKIYLSTAIGLTPGGSVTVHTINTYNNSIITEQHK